MNALTDLLDGNSTLLNRLTPNDALLEDIFCNPKHTLNNMVASYNRQLWSAIILEKENYIAGTVNSLKSQTNNRECKHVRINTDRRMN
ncbi:hypothetical protein GJ496_004856 [Pomphorhynchus laevis]|nr:hypothetical protein GJ496_004856 [Pomphorhynchus laevis]